MLDLTADPIALTAALVDIPSESRHEQLIADEIEGALKAQAPHFEVVRNGDAVLARTNLGRPSRVLLAGHTDTVPAADNLPSRLEGGELWGCGTSDMKAGDAVFLHLAATIAKPTHDITLVMYDCEEIEAAARAAAIDGDIQGFAQGYQSLIGERGVSLDLRGGGRDRFVRRGGGVRGHGVSSIGC